MSNFFDDPMLNMYLKKSNDDFTKREEAKKILKDAEEMERIYEAMKAHDALEYQKLPKERTHYQDDYGYDVIAIRTHSGPRLKNGVAWNIAKLPKEPKEKYPDEYEFSVEYPLLDGLGEYSQDLKIKADKSIFFNTEGKRYVLWNYLLVIRGEMYIAYRHIGEKKTYFEKPFIKYMNDLYKTKHTEIRELDFDKFERFFTFRVNQIIKRVKLPERKEE